MAQNDNYVDILVDILSKQVSTLEDVLRITKTQEDIANATDFDEEAFDESLMRKDICIAKLNEYDNAFVSVYDRVKNAVKADTNRYADKISNIQSLIRRCTDLGNEISTLETRNKDKLAVCFSGKKQEYTARQTAATVAGKYNTTMKNANLMGEGYRFNLDK
ncbi:MAG: hypothetical protein K6G76_07390 [Lachnospiraceae bacterium]|nr:hypothetical protein [Lachnospiraceae bacterium]